MSRLPYLLPYVRVLRLLHTILTTRWDETTSPIIRQMVPRVLKWRSQIAKDGWWN